MTKAFEAVLSKINSQASHLEGLDERAVELAVILPLLKRVGWDTEDMIEIYPQKLLSSGGKVDYELRTGGQSRVFIEAKRWNHTLTDEDEGQLRDYCLAAKTNLAVLTNGRQWRLFLPPIRTRRKGQVPELRQFLVLDITHEYNSELERNFARFLARRSIEDKRSVDQVVSMAQQMFDDQVKAARETRTIDDVVDRITPEELAAFVASELEKETGQPVDVERIKNRLLARQVTLSAKTSGLTKRKGVKDQDLLHLPSSQRMSSRLREPYQGTRVGINC